jgi:hypothetical protein
VRVELPAGAPRVVVLDDGGGFDPDALPAGTAGRGLAIARAVCPGLRISATSTGTEVVLPLPTVAP